MAKPSRASASPRRRNELQRAPAAAPMRRPTRFPRRGTSRSGRARARTARHRRRGGRADARGAPRRALAATSPRTRASGAGFPPRGRGPAPAPQCRAPAPRAHARAAASGHSAKNRRSVRGGVARHRPGTTARAPSRQRLAQAHETKPRHPRGRRGCDAAESPPRYALAAFLSFFLSKNCSSSVEWLSAVVDDWLPCTVVVTASK